MLKGESEGRELGRSSGIVVAEWDLLVLLVFTRSVVGHAYFQTYGVLMTVLVVEYAVSSAVSVSKQAPDPYAFWHDHST